MQWQPCKGPPGGSAIRPIRLSDHSSLLLHVGRLS
jgi:hypothetical protein